MKGVIIMSNKIVSTKHNYIMPNISNDMSITTFGDLHYCSSFDDKRLDLLTEYLFNNDSKYLFIAGDLIDSTNFLHDDKIKGNVGIIAPNKSLFPDNARGTKDINVGDKDIHLIINGGITKLSECTNILGKFNGIYKMNIDEIKINSKVKKLVK